LHWRARRSDWNVESIGTLRIIQIDEAGIKEGLPLKNLIWQVIPKLGAVDFVLSFVLASAPSHDANSYAYVLLAVHGTFLPDISAWTRDVITIETSRSEL